jgi:predicted RND superfamily exporter protein
MPATHAARRLAPSVGSAAATTVVGFAGLLLAQHPGLWSMGFTASVGIGIIALSCLLFLPSLADLLALLRTHRHPASHC